MDKFMPRTRASEADLRGKNRGCRETLLSRVMETGAIMITIMMMMIMIIIVIIVILLLIIIIIITITIPLISLTFACLGPEERLNIQCNSFNTCSVWMLTT